VQIAMLGPLEVRADSGEPVEIGGARLRTLLILLALEPGRVLTIRRIVDALWGDAPPGHAANAVQALVSRLRRAVPEIVIESTSLGYRLNVSPEAVDVPRFERLVGTGRAALAEDPARAGGTLRTALALWRGPALADVAEAGFAQAPIARLSELRLAAVEDRIEADLRLGTTVPQDLVPELGELVTAYPVREGLAGQLMRALVAAGRPADALSAYERVRRTLADRLGVDPSPELAALHVAILRADERPRATETEPRTNLRAALTSFVGRDEEIERVGKLLGESRLTTLTGPGGAGKTRLAIEAARTAVASMPDGVWLAELAPVNDPGEAAQTVLSTLGLREQVLISRSRLAETAEPADPTARIVSALAGKRLLLVLDNCEHLIGAAAALVDQVLGGCPAVRIVATSREPLGITGETLWPVEPLALPPADTATAADTAMGYASVRLLVDRAAAVRPGFAVDAHNVAAVVAICRALDGMPLAIELAAARLRAMSPEQVAARLGDRFRLLTGGSRTALPRHQTLRAVVDWSWDLLDDAERALWRRLAVFTGGATLEAAEQVCAGGEVRGDAVLDLLTALVDKSLVVVTGDGQPRYRMLETIRAYGFERLDAAGERERVRRAHAEYFVGLAETAEPHLRGGEQLHWLARLAEDHDNMQAALRGAIAAGDAEPAIRLVAALGWYWWLHGHRAEGSTLAADAVNMPGEVADEWRARAYIVAAMTGLDQGTDIEAASSQYRAAMDLGAWTDAAHPLLRLGAPLAMAFFPPHRFDGLAALYDDHDPWVRATARLMHAFATVNVGRAHAGAEADLRAALDGFRALNERWGISFALVGLGELIAQRGDHRATADCYAQAVACLAELGTHEDVSQFQARYAYQLWLAGDEELAWAALDEARRGAERVGMLESQVGVDLMVAELARLSGDLERARRHAAAVAVHIGRPNLAPQQRALIASLCGILAAADGDSDAARRHHAEAVGAALEAQDYPVVAQVLVGVADYALHSGEPGRAATLLAASESIRGVPDRSLRDVPRIAAAARAALGDSGFAAAYARGQAAEVGSVWALTGLKDRLDP
jgi:predicted ATPase/DNA-binding SARP family transcriptional activator